jgi:hypothetical protein
MKRVVLFLVALNVALLSAGYAAASSGRSWSAYARLGMQQFLGGSRSVAWNRWTGLWGGRELARWWQSAQAIETVVQYAERTNKLGSVIQHVLLRTYELNHNAKPGKYDDFRNGFRDDTARWGVAWEMASQYELYHQHDRADAARFLHTAEEDASFLANLPRDCGGLRWVNGFPPNAISNALFVDLTARLARYRRYDGIFHSGAKATHWRRQAHHILSWMRHSGLIDVSQGKVTESLTDACKPGGGSRPVTEGEVADAFVQMGYVMHDRSYYRQAANFLRYTTSPTSPFMDNGILRDRCLSQSPTCDHELSVTSGLGLFMLAMDDWDRATRSSAFRPFLRAQLTSIVTHDMTPPPCCWFGLSWGGGVQRMLVTTGTQESALSALIAGADLPLYGRAPDAAAAKSPDRLVDATALRNGSAARADGYRTTPWS